MVALNDSHGIISFNRDNFNLYANSSYILVEFLTNKVLAYISSDLVKRA
jgi:hypothetical protein